jgi:long-chain acyl-CoA synthetase
MSANGSCTECTGRAPDGVAGLGAAADDAICLDDGHRTWDRATLRAQVQAFATQLSARNARVLATLLDNSAAWVVADLAAAQSGVVHVPLPAFFTPAQIVHALRSAGVDLLLTSPIAAASWPQSTAQPIELAGHALVLLPLPASQVAMPAGTAKITYTSGTTGQPKGVCLGSEAMQRVSEGLRQAMAPLAIGRHLCALPFSVLLENIAGLLAPLAQGTVCITLPMRELGLSGASGFDVVRFHAVVAQHRPHSVILLPQMLRAWTAHLMMTGERASDSLKFVAVGGAAVGARLIAAARAVGIPAYEGYGLSEGASVQTLNLPGADRPGTAGRALPHTRLRIAADGEIEVAGSLFNGYLGDAAPAASWWPSGDLGRIDDDGFVHLQGRKKHVLITAYGRNVSPEWVETALCAEPAIAQAVVFGEAQPALSAVLWPVRPEASDATLQAAVDNANATLPDYARVQRWVRAGASFDASSGMATANGRPQRMAIWQRHAHALGARCRSAAVYHLALR